jgi:hypothetical protein
MKTQQTLNFITTCNPDDSATLPHNALRRSRDKYKVTDKHNKFMDDDINLVVKYVIQSTKRNEIIKMLRSNYNNGKLTLMYYTDGSVADLGTLEQVVLLLLFKLQNKIWK